MKYFHSTFLSHLLYLALVGLFCLELLGAEAEAECLPPQNSLKVNSHWLELSPQETLDQLNTTSPPLTNICWTWWSSYKTALALLQQGQTTDSCNIFKQLSGTTNFPLQNHAHKRWKAHCTFQEPADPTTHKPPRKKQREGPKTQPTPFQKLYNQALSLYRSSKNHAAIAALDEALTFAETKDQSASAYMLKGKVETNISLWGEGLASFEAALSCAPTQRELRREASWFRAWSLKMLGQNEQAILRLQQLISTYTQPQDPTSLYAFWLNQLARQQQLPDLAQQALEDVKHYNPLSFYHLYILQQQGILKDYLGLKPQQSHLSQGQNPLSIQQPLLLWLVGVGELQWARQYVQKNFPLNPNLPLSDNLKRVSYHGLAHNFLEIIRYAGKLKAQDQISLLHQKRDFLFPMPYEGLFRKAAQRHSFPLSLILSIARQESTFNPKAVSPAKAYGIMQLLLSTAREQAHREGIQARPTVKSLLTPWGNIPLGVSFLNHLTTYYSSDPISIIAAYNAGESRLDFWKQKFQNQTDLEFMENIPFKETRKYTKLVLRNQMIYEWLLSQNTTTP